MSGFARTGDLIDLDQIGRMKIVYIGAGSLSSFTASGLLYPFGNQHFVDPGVMKEANLERHWVDTRIKSVYRKSLPSEIGSLQQL